MPNERCKFCLENGTCSSIMRFIKLPEILMIFFNEKKTLLTTEMSEGAVEAARVPSAKISFQETLDLKRFLEFNAKQEI